jgi:hypothetical protein
MTPLSRPMGGHQRNPSTMPRHHGATPSMSTAAFEAMGLHGGGPRGSFVAGMTPSHGSGGGFHSQHASLQIPASAMPQSLRGSIVGNLFGAAAANAVAAGSAAALTRVGSSAGATVITPTSGAAEDVDQFWKKMDDMYGTGLAGLSDKKVIHFITPSP